MADITDYPARDHAFDVVFFNHVLEHIPDDDRALREAHRILKPGGLLILGVPNEGAWFWQLAYRLQPEILRTSDHVHFYTAPSLAAQCRGAGFTVQEVRPIGWGVPHWTLDSLVRRFRWVDDAFEWLGRRLLRSQATSLYLLLTK
jgi:SAM-dependent methyltransferase